MNTRVKIDGDFHYHEDWTQRVTRAQWRHVLLLKQDTIIVKGIVRQLVAKDIGCGVMEISLRPLGPLE